MWPGIFHISTEEFQQNDVVVILARNTLISDYISTLGDNNENDGSDSEETKSAGARQTTNEADDEEDAKENEPEEVKETPTPQQIQQNRQMLMSQLLSEFIPIGCGRMLMKSIP